jgi:hypothetical protein
MEAEHLPEEEGGENAAAIVVGGEGNGADDNANVNVNVIGNHGGGGKDDDDDDDDDDGDDDNDNIAEGAAAEQDRSRSSSRPRRPPHRLMEELNRRQLERQQQQQHEDIGGRGGGDGGDQRQPRVNRMMRPPRRLRQQQQQYQQHRRPGAPRQHEPEPHSPHAVLVENCDDEMDVTWDEEDLLSLPDEATWPKATPTPHGECYLSVSCDGLGWAWTHYKGAQELFDTSVLWRYVLDWTTRSWRRCRSFCVLCWSCPLTAYSCWVPSSSSSSFWKLRVRRSTNRFNPASLGKSNPATVDPMPSLRPFLPPNVQEFFFGESDPRNYDPKTGGPSVVSRNRALRTAALRAVPIVNVYALMDREDDLRAITFLLSQMPVKVYRLRPSDFVMGPIVCETASVVEEPADRLAAVAGAMFVTDHKVPVMVVVAAPDVVTMTTVTADYRVAEMGISCGILAKLRALAHTEDQSRHHVVASSAAAAAAAAAGPAAAPSFSSSSISTQHVQLEALIKDVKERGEPIDLFGGGTGRTEMERRLGPALYEMGAYLTATATHWMQDATKQLEDVEENEGALPAASPSVMVCGIDSDLVEDVLNSKHTNLIYPPVVGHPEGGIETVVCKNLVSKGVQALLLAKYEELMEVCETSGEERARRTALGCRVAKHFGSRAYRGTVVSVVVSGGTFDEDLYMVKYDDGDEEDYYPYELYGTCACVDRW